VGHVYACVNMRYVLRKLKVHTWLGRVGMDEGGPASCSLVGYLVHTHVYADIFNGSELHNRRAAIGNEPFIGSFRWVHTPP
jgi:hypothetical protein